mgnify:CR=1 FL=1
MPITANDLKFQYVWLENISNILNWRREHLSEMNLFIKVMFEFIKGVS